MAPSYQAISRGDVTVELGVHRGKGSAWRKCLTKPPMSAPRIPRQVDEQLHHVLALRISQSIFDYTLAPVGQAHFELAGLQLVT
jgi:hypothetical protein